MKLKFKVQPYQTNAVESVVDCFAEQVNTSGIAYRIDPGVAKNRAEYTQASLLEDRRPAAGQYPYCPAATESVLVGQASVKRRMQGQS